MSEIVNTLPYSADLSKSLDKTDLHTLFVMGDNQAHRFELEILSGSKAVDLTGATVTGYFTNFKEDTTVTVPGKVEGGKAVVVLSKPCYTLRGQFVLAIQVKIGEVEDTVFLGEGFMRRTKGETIIYDDYIVYDVNTLLAQISAMKTATDNANKAAADANAAAEHAPHVDEATGFWMYWDVGAGKYVSTGTPATGPQGAPGNDGEDGETPYIGSNGNWWIGQTDTGVKAQGPAGANGTGSGTVTGVKIGENTYAPDSSGLVDMSGMTAPNADQLNGKDADQYMLKTDTAADSDKLGGKAPSEYASASSVNALGATTFINANTRWVQTGFISNPTSASNDVYVAPENGFFYIYATRGETAGNTLFVYVLDSNNNAVATFNLPAYYAYAVCCMYIPVSKGMKIKLFTDASKETWLVREQMFYY